CSSPRIGGRRGWHPWRDPTGKTSRLASRPRTCESPGAVARAGWSGGERSALAIRATRLQLLLGVAVDRGEDLPVGDLVIGRGAWDHVTSSLRSSRARTRTSTTARGRCFRRAPVN